MGMSFYAGCYFVPRQKREDTFANIYQHCQTHGFDYVATERYEKSFEEQLNRIANNEADSFWISGNGGKMLVSIGDQPEKLGFPVESKMALLHFIFDYYFITTDDEAQNQKFLESFISLQTELYLSLNSELGWGGYNPHMPECKDYLSSEIKSLYWFNILSSRFVENIGKDKLLNAPGWEIKEMPSEDVIIRLSEHPHIYEKREGVFLHTYLDMDIRN